MKKIISLTLVALLTLALVACNPNQEETEKLQQNVQSLQERLEQLEESNEDMQEQISAQQKEKELLQKKLDNLMGEPIYFTAVAPVYGPKEDVNRAWASFRNVYVHGELNEEESDYDSNNYNPFEELYNCYINEISPTIENEICMLDPCDGELGIYSSPKREKEYHILVGGDGSAVINPMIEQHMVIKDEVLGSDDERDCSFSLTLYFEPVSNISKIDKYLGRTLEFGNNAMVAGRNLTYFNIYISSTCIGTCYYLANSYISAKWFNDYFNSKYNAKLYYGGRMLP